MRIFIDTSFPSDAMKLLQDGTTGHELIVSNAPSSSVLDVAKWDDRIVNAHVFFGQIDPVFIERAKDLKWIHVSSSGITRYDNKAFREIVTKRNIAVSNSASVYKEQCAVHALSFIVAQARNLPDALKTRTACGTRQWHELRASCTPLQNQTVLLFGFGAIGTRLAELLKPFQMNVLAYRRKARGTENVPVISSGQLESILSMQVDHIVNILPYSAETHHFFNARFFSQVKPGAVFYNIGRGATVDQDALLNALQSRRLKAAWLDVTDPEPLGVDNPLLSEPHCFITPHVAGGDSDEVVKLIRHFNENCARFTKNEELIDRVM